MNVLIVYERKNRELENSVLLKIELEKRGHSCTIAQFYQGSSFNILGRKKYDVIFVPHLYDSQEVIRTFARFGKSPRIINLQYEQVLSEKWEALGHHTPSGLAQKFEHICWGPKTSSRLINAGVMSESVHNIGAIQLDLLRPEYRDEGKLKSLIGKRYKLDADKKWILFLSSFTYADIEQSRLLMNERVSGTTLGDFVDIHTKSRDEILQWYDEELQKNSIDIFIYRPHPDELNLSKVERLSTRYPNFYIIGSESAKIWIECSDKIFSWYSTTVVESHFLEKPYSILRPYPLPEYFDSVLLKKGKFITSKDDFSSALQDIKNKFALSESDVAEYYIATDVPVFKMISDLVECPSVESVFPPISIPLKNRLTALLVYHFYILDRLASRFDIIYKTLNKVNFYKSWSQEIKNQACTPSEIRSLEVSLMEKVDV